MALCKNHENHKLLIFTPLLRLFDMACYATSALTTRIQEVSEYKKSIKKQRNLI